MRRPHLIVGQRALFDRNIVKLHLGMAVEKRHHGKTVQTGAKPRFSDRQVAAGGESGRKVVAIQKHMPRLGKPIRPAIIAVGECIGIGHPVPKADLGRRQIIDGTTMW